MEGLGSFPGVGLMVRVVSLGSQGPEFKSHSAVNLIPGGIDSVCHPSKVSKMSTSLLERLSHLSILRRSGDTSRNVPNSPGDCFGSTDALYRVWSQWIGLDWMLGLSGMRLLEKWVLAVLKLFQDEIYALMTSS